MVVWNKYQNALVRTDKSLSRSRSRSLARYTEDLYHDLDHHLDLSISRFRSRPINISSRSCIFRCGMLCIVMCNNYQDNLVRTERSLSKSRSRLLSRSTEDLHHNLDQQDPDICRYKMLCMAMWKNIKMLW